MSDVNPTTHQIEVLGNAMATLSIGDTTGDNTVKTIANPPSATQESPCWRLARDPHLQDRRDAKAAASDLRCVQQFLEDYRMSCYGRYEPDRRLQVMIMPSYFRACAKFRAIAHPGERAQKAFDQALLEMHWTLGQLINEYKRAQFAREAALVARVGVWGMSPHLPSIRPLPIR